MKKLKTLILAGMVACALGIGVIISTPKSAPVDVAAASETTVYYAVPSEVVGNYTVKLNVNFRGDGDWWNAYVMEKTSETYDGKDVYKCTYTDAYNGVGCMQFQLYDGDSWISQQQPYDSWTPIVNYNHRIYVHNIGWDTFIPSFETYIPMNPQFFTNWTDDAGSFADKDATFWDQKYSFEALDVFFRGESKEGWTGTLTSRTWKQSTQFVYFQLGGARDYDHGDAGHAHLVFHYGSYVHDFYNNTFVENPMTLRYFKIPDNEFAAMTANSSDFDMYVEVVDPVGYGFGFVNLGYFHVNQTEESTSDAMRYFLNHLSADTSEWEINKRKEIFNTYFDNANQREVFFRTVSDISDSFSTNADFTKHWYFDYNYFNNDGAERHVDQAIGTDSYRPDDNYSNMPFNNEGGFFRGWYEGSANAGFVASDALRYRFISRPFVLSGTGLISIKMAGKASLHVIDTSVKNTDSQPADLAWVDNKGFNDAGDMTNLESGFNTATMVRHVINLEEYVGKTIQLAICDYDTSGWSAAYFDSLVTNYSSYPGFKIECPFQTNNSGTHYPVYRDIYINSACKNDGNQYGVIYNAGNGVNTADDSAILNHQDTTGLVAAHDVWESYLNSVRGGNSGNNYCDALVSDDIKAMLRAYDDLTATGKQVVCASDDFERLLGVPTVYGPTHEYNIGRSLVYLGSVNGIPVSIVTSGSLMFFMSEDNQSLVAIVAIVCVLSISLLTSLIVLKKKKEHIQ